MEDNVLGLWDFCGGWPQNGQQNKFNKMADKRWSPKVPASLLDYSFTFHFTTRISFASKRIMITPETIIYTDPDDSFSYIPMNKRLEQKALAKRELNMTAPGNLSYKTHLS